jgi:hypothetical protein
LAIKHSESGDNFLLLNENSNHQILKNLVCDGILIELGHQAESVEFFSDEIVELLVEGAGGGRVGVTHI